MKTFTIDKENNISVFATAEETAAGAATPFDTFSTQEELAQLASAWPAERLVALWNSLPGVTPAKKVKDRNTAVQRIWKRIQRLGESAAKPEAQPEPASTAATTEAQPAGDPPAAQADFAASGKPANSPRKAKATKKAAAKKSAKATRKKAAAKPASGKGDGPREGSKMAQAIALMQRKDGVTISDLMKTMGWQKHTCRGFVAGAMKKAGYNVESFKPEGGERTYRLPK